MADEENKQKVGVGSMPVAAVSGDLERKASARKFLMQSGQSASSEAISSIAADKSFVLPSVTHQPTAQPVTPEAAKPAPAVAKVAEAPVNKITSVANTSKPVQRIVSPDGSISYSDTGIAGTKPTGVLNGNVKNNYDENGVLIPEVQRKASNNFTDAYLASKPKEDASKTLPPLDLQGNINGDREAVTTKKTYELYTNDMERSNDKEQPRSYSDADAVKDTGQKVDNTVEAPVRATETESTGGVFADGESATTTASKNPITENYKAYKSTVAAPNNAAIGTVSTIESSNAKDTSKTINDGTAYNRTKERAEAIYAAPTESTPVQPQSAPPQTPYQQSNIQSNVTPNQAANESIQRQIAQARNTIANGDMTKGADRIQAKYAQKFLDSMLDSDVKGKLATQLTQDAQGQKDYSQQRENVLEGWKALLAGEKADKELSQKGEEFGQSQDLAERKLALDSQPKPDKQKEDKLIQIGENEDGTKKYELESKVKADLIASRETERIAKAKAILEPNSGATSEQIKAAKSLLGVK